MGHFAFMSVWQAGMISQSLPDWILWLTDQQIILFSIKLNTKEIIKKKKKKYGEIKMALFKLGESEIYICMLTVQV